MIFMYKDKLHKIVFDEDSDPKLNEKFLEAVKTFSPSKFKNPRCPKTFEGFLETFEKAKAKLVLIEEEEEIL